MKNFKEIADKCLNGELSGTFIKRAGGNWESKYLHRSKLLGFVKYPYYFKYGCLIQSYSETGKQCFLEEADIIDFIPDTNMKENELTIEIPGNKVVDWDESKKQNKIVLKDKQLTYEDICNRLPGMIDVSLFDTPSKDGNALVANEHQLECLLAKNKLATVAKYLNDGWKPDEDYMGHFDAWFLYLTSNKNYIGYGKTDNCCENSNVLFKSFELANQALKILGEETVKLALEPLGV